MKIKECCKELKLYINDNITIKYCPNCGTKLELEPEVEMETWYQNKYYNTITKAVIEELSTIAFKSNVYFTLLSTKSVTVPKGTPIGEIYNLLKEKENGND